MNSLLEKLMRQGEISALSYQFARFIAEQSDAEVDSLLACTAALVSESNQRGDVCVMLAEYCEQPLFDNQHDESMDMPRGIAIEPWQDILLASPCVGNAGDQAPLILENQRIYLNRFWHYETHVAEMIHARLGAEITLDYADLGRQLLALFPSPKPATDIDAQMLAVALAAIKPFSVISGGPGTGKTTTVIKLLAILIAQHPQLRIRLAAPTGKAAARMMESIRPALVDGSLDPAICARIPTEASTLHRLLGYRNRGFRYNAENPLALDCLVIDEASMIDLTLMYHLLAAVPAQARIILLGDRDQLASVAAGSVLGDITGHGQAIAYSSAQLAQLGTVFGAPVRGLSEAPTATAMADSVTILNKSYRFSAQSGIGRLASLINQGEGEKALQCLLSEAAQLSWHATESDQLDSDMLDIMVAAYCPVIDSDQLTEALAAFEQTRVLCAVHAGPFGVNEINQRITTALRARLNLDTNEDYRGKPIMISANDYELGLYNGDTGLLWPNRDGELRACFRDNEGGMREFAIANLPAHVTAWAMTVHKAQGSEFDSVLLLLPGDEEIQLTRELLYTAVTRARTRLLLQAHPGIFVAACQRLSLRRSALAQKLGW